MLLVFICNITRITECSADIRTPTMPIAELLPQYFIGAASVLEVVAKLCSNLTQYEGRRKYEAITRLIIVY